jgi:hypothetical protein
MNDETYEVGVDPASGESRTGFVLMLGERQAGWANDLQSIVTEEMSRRYAEGLNNLLLYGNAHKGKAPGVRSTR